MRPDLERDFLTLEGVTFTSSGGNGAGFTVWAERAHLDPESQELWLEQVGLTIHASAGREAVELRSAEGYFEMKNESFRLRGKVRGRIGAEQVFRGQWVAYDEARDLLYSDASVEMEESGSLYQGGGFRYRVADGVLELVSGVQVFKQ